MNPPDRSEFTPVEWTPETIGRFWRFWASRERPETEFFSARHGAGLVGLLKWATSLKDKDVLDYGCGPGFLIPRLLEASATVWAADASKVFVDAANERFRCSAGWRGARLSESRLSWPESSFDVVCCLETIEHVTASELGPLLDDIRRVLKTGGIAVFTVPNDEHLEPGNIACPKCGCVFHRWQHLQSWTEASLRKRLEHQGYRVLLSQGLFLGRFQNGKAKTWKDVSPRLVLEWIRRCGCAFLDQMRPCSFPCQREFQYLIRTGGTPHLVAVVEKVGN